MKYSFVFETGVLCVILKCVVNVNIMHCKFSIDCCHLRLAYDIQQRKVTLQSLLYHTMIFVLTCICWCALSGEVSQVLGMTLPCDHHMFDNVR